MKLRFEVNQIEAFRKGIDCPKSIITVEVDPKILDQKTRDLVADRMVGGIDICELELDTMTGKPRIRLSDKGLPCRIKTCEPTFEAMMKAVEENGI